MNSQKVHKLNKNEVFELLNFEIAGCKKCVLHEKRQNPVPGEGNLDARLFFVGEGPGATEDQLGRPFVGAAGKVLEALLSSIGLERKDVFIGNTVKCRPPENRTPSIEEIKSCESFLLSQIALVEPQWLVLLGNAALTAFLGTSKTISQVRGTLIQHEGISFFPVFHPAACLYRKEVLEQTKKDFEKLNQIMKEKNND